MQFATEDDVIDYVEREIAKVIPSGWSFVREARNPLVWQIKPDEPSASAPIENYRLHVTDDRKLFVLEHGNTDAGALSLYHVLLNAKVIEAQAFDIFPLSEAIRYVMERCEPNLMGLT